MSLAGGEHGEVALEIGRLIANHAKPRRLGTTHAAETGFIVERDSDTVRAADVGFVKHERVLLIVNPGRLIPFAPDLAVEVLSPNDRRGEVEEKVAMCLAAGSQVVWTVDRGLRSVTVYRPGVAPVVLRPDDEIDGGDVIPGFVCRVADFFA